MFTGPKQFKYKPRYYDEDVEWIEAKIKEGKLNLESTAKIYAGLFTGFFKPDQLNNAVKRSLDAGADGFSLFAYHQMRVEHWLKLSDLEKDNDEGRLR